MAPTWAFEMRVSLPWDLYVGWTDSEIIETHTHTQPLETNPSLAEQFPMK